jgi:hypothetical protein
MVLPSEGNEARREGCQDVGASHSTVEAGERVVHSDPGEGRGRRVTELLGGNMASALELDPVSTKHQQIAKSESVP